MRRPFSTDFILCDQESDFFFEIRNEINTRSKPERSGGAVRAVIVFLENKDILMKFFHSEFMNDLKSKTRVITEDIHPNEKAGAFLQATLSGAVSLMIREYGRGTDFKCFDSNMLDSGGVHVIQAFFSTDRSEEIQLKGRTARQGCKGSFR